MFRRTRSTSTEAVPWSRPRLLLLLGAVTGFTLLLVGGLIFAGWHAFVATPADSDVDIPVNPGPAPHSDPVASRDQIAAQPMLTVGRDASYTPDPALIPAGVIHIPLPVDGRGPAGVATGLPHTPEGAVAQLAAIEQQVLEAMSLPVARQVWQAWTLPGAPAFEQWELTHSVQSFLASARQAGDTKDTTTVVTATPAAALIKGVDGPDWVLACVLLDVRAVVVIEARMGYGHCARMEWAEGRWQIASGEAPAVAPSTWPGSKLAVEAGWLTWTTDERQG
ncbi:MAG: hypothetical protein LCH76_14005 [Actinobacteria bacterium]|nr:hypothetical protein [Actinomycetota bacterium]